MRITFHKESERDYHSIALRSDGVSVRIRGVGRWVGLPHDFAHYFVEHGLGLRYGFWGQIALGAVWPQVEILSGRQKPHAKERSKEILRDNAKGISHSEVIVRLFVEITEQEIDSNWDATSKKLRESPEVPRGPKISFEKELVDDICEQLRIGKEHWLNLAIGSSITVDW